MHLIRRGVHNSNLNLGCEISNLFVKMGSFVLDYNLSIKLARLGSIHYGILQCSLSRENAIK